MSRQVFINLTVENLDQSKDFATHLGFTINPQFTDDTAACVVVSEEIFFMLLTHDKFKQFAPNEITDTKASNEAIICLSCDSREEVDEFVRKATEKGAHSFREATDYGFMYQHGFQDPNGHVWEFIYMNMEAFAAMQNQG